MQGRNINDLRYADDTTIMAESKEKLKNLLMRVKESERASLRLKTKKELRSWHLLPFSSVQFSHSVVSDSATPWITARQASLSITNSQSLLRLMSVESVMPSSHLILCCPLLLLPPIPPSIRVFSNESTLHMRWPNYWSFSFSISPSMNTQDWSPLGWTGWISLQSKGLLSLLQHHSSEASILRHSAFFTIQLSHPYMTTRKAIALTRQTFGGKVMSLLFNMLFRLVITFLPRSNHLLISWLQSPSTVILEPKKIKSDTVPTVSPFISHEVMGPDAMILVFWMLSFKPTFSLSSFTFSSVQFSSVTQAYPTLQPHESQHARPSCPSQTPGVCSNSCPSSRWCHPAISSSVVPFSSFTLLHGK